MKLYRFSPIKDRTQLLEAIKYVHFACYKLCNQVIGKYLPVLGNIGIFCHYDEEYKLLKKFRENLTDSSDNIDQKYYRLHNPIIIPAINDLPETTYTHLYIRQPDPYRPHVGDLDFFMEPEKYAELKNSLLEGRTIKGARVFERPDLDMIELYDPDIDALAFVRSEKLP